MTTAMTITTIAGLTGFVVAAVGLIAGLVFEPRGKWRNRQLERGLRKLYPDDPINGPTTWKTDDHLRAEARLWKRAGYPETAQALINAIGTDDDGS